MQQRKVVKDGNLDSFVKEIYKCVRSPKSEVRSSSFGLVCSVFRLLPFFFIFSFVLLSSAAAQEPLRDKVFFSNSIMDGDYFYSKVSYKSPSWVANRNGKLPVNDQHFTPGNSLELHYQSEINGNWQADVLYHPIRGMDHFKPAVNLRFWMYVDSETAPNELPNIAIGEKEGTMSVYLPVQNYIENLQQKQWTVVLIPLTDFKNGPEGPETIERISFQQQSQDGKEHRIYIDQIELVPNLTDETVEETPEINSATGFERHIDLTWQPVQDQNIRYIQVYRSSDGENFKPVGIQHPFINRYADYTGEVNREYFYRITFLDQHYRESSSSEIVNAKTKELSDEELLDMVQRAHFNYYWEGAETNSGLSLENIPGRGNMIASGASGFGIMALIVGTERNFISRKQAIERFLNITSFLEKAEKFHGAFSHFIDGPSGKVVPFFGPKDNGGDLVETAFLVQGLLAAQQYFNRQNDEEKIIREKIQNIWEGIEWSWYQKEPDSQYLFWHWSPDQEWVINHKLIGWNETMIVYLLGIASPTHPIPASLYYSGWASQDEEAQQYRRNWGQTKDGQNYENGNTYYGIPLNVGVSTGGPLFFIHYSYLGPDPHQINDTYTNYFENNRNIALINYRYCLENPENHQGYGADCWGLTASDGPWRYSASEPKPEMDDGKMTPTGALASFPYTPEKSMAALKNYYRNYGHFLWGEYGFRDAFNLDENWCSEIFMGLNQAPIVVMIENHRTGLIWDLFMKNQDVQNALKKIKNK